MRKPDIGVATATQMRQDLKAAHADRKILAAETLTLARPATKT
ncbi:hypothetical protein ACWDKQ_11120 [Saccharopolyspora sp. NPDC000995]